MPPETLSEEESRYLKSQGAKLGRNRSQAGWVEEVKTKHATKWRGHYFVYRLTDDGKEKRQHKTIELGEKGKVTKTAAKELLRNEITKKVGNGVAKPSDDITVAQFYEKNYLPLHETNWKESSRDETKANIRRYIITPLGAYRLNGLNKFILQKHLNDLGAKFSKSVVDKAFTYSKKICKEAMEQDFLQKDPSSSLRKPTTKDPVRETVCVEKLQSGFAKLERREQIMLRLALVIGLRPNEILALHWNDMTEDGLRIDEGAVDGKLYDPKTKGSKATILLPYHIREDLESYRGEVPNNQDDDLMFPSPKGFVARLDNYRKRFFNPAMAKAGLKGMTFQMCRRSCSTWMVNGKHGTLKDAQALLRHSQASTTLGIYVQEQSESVRSAIGSLDRMLFGKSQPVTPEKKSGDLNNYEQESGGRARI